MCIEKVAGTIKGSLIDLTIKPNSSGRSNNVECPTIKKEDLIMRILSGQLLIGLIFLMSISPAKAVNEETGKYSAWEIYKGFIWSRDADRPLDDEDFTYPLKPREIPNEYDDGFDSRKYYRWQAITLPPETGAACADGSPYTFFVNLTPFNNNTSIYFEGGGYCYDYYSCTGHEDATISSSNQNGISEKHMNIIPSFDSEGSPIPHTGELANVMMQRLQFSGSHKKAKSQKWNMVFLPNCTGDIFLGDKVTVFEKPEEEEEPEDNRIKTLDFAPLVGDKMIVSEESEGNYNKIQHFKGMPNVLSVVSWLRNTLPQPANQLVSGCGAGSAGSLSTYPIMRQFLEPTHHSALYADSGLVATGNLREEGIETYPTKNLVDVFFNLYGDIDLKNYVPGSGQKLPPIFQFFEEQAQEQIDFADTSFFYRTSAAAFPEDRLGASVFSYDYFGALAYQMVSTPALEEAREQELALRETLTRYQDGTQPMTVGNLTDGSIPPFSNLSHPSSPTSPLGKQVYAEMFSDELDRTTAVIDDLPNSSYFIPGFRRANGSHCATAIDWLVGSEIEEQDLHVTDYINNLLTPSEPMFSARESVQGTEIDFRRGVSWLQTLLNLVLPDRVIYRYDNSELD